MYGEHFGFSDLPFSVTPNPRFYYANPLHHEAFASLRYGIEARKGFVVITGEVGTGKTTLLKIFMHSVESTVHTAFIFNPKLDFIELLRFVLNELGISTSGADRLTLMGQLNDYLIEQLKRNHIVALLVDEAQDLSDDLLEELRLLSNFETDKAKLIQIVLIGQPELDRRLDQPEFRQLKQRVAVRCRLAPLGSDQVAPYINCRLKTVGYEGKQLFDPAAVRRIAEYSRRIPRLINIICDNALLIAYTTSQRSVSADIVEQVAWNLQLTGQAEAERPTSNTGFAEPNDGVEVIVDEPEPEFESEEEPMQHYKKGRLLTLRTGMFCGCFLLLAGAAAVGYFPLSRNDVSELAAGVETLSQQGENYLSELSVSVGSYLQRAKVDLLALTLKAKDFTKQGENYFSDLAVRVQTLAETRPENVRRVKLISETPETNPSRSRLAASHDPDPEVKTGPSDNATPAPEEPPLVTQDSQEQAMDEHVVPAPQTEPKTLNAPVIPDEGRATGGWIKNNSKRQPLEAKVTVLKDDGVASEPKRLSRNHQGVFLGNFEVVGNSFVRGKPRSDAEIIATLRPGTWVRVENKSGDYLQVRSLDGPEIRGYVHLQDALFQRVR